MKNLELTRYYTLNSWNKSTSPAYNLKIYKVIDWELQEKAYALLDCADFWDEINQMKSDFSSIFGHSWQAGFNGRSGGYLVLYQGGIKDNRIFSYPGKGIEIEEVPENVLTAFEQLAKDIVAYAEDCCKKYKVVEQTILVPKQVSVMQEIDALV